MTPITTCAATLVAVRLVAPRHPGTPLASTPRTPQTAAPRDPGEQAAPHGPLILAQLFPVVALGASAGGLAALEQFFSHTLDGSGMAFVVVQHLDPTHGAMLPDLLKRFTTMKVREVSENMQIWPGNVYVIPPGKDLTLAGGLFHLHEPAEPRGLRLPIDSFFASLADERRQHAIGVILSGMGADGTRGLRAIKEKGGMTLAQDPTEAGFDSMPRSAIDAGLADHVARAAELPARVLDHLQDAPLARASDAPLDAGTHESIEKVLALLKARTHNDFSVYKRNTLFRRIARRMDVHQIARLDRYVHYLEETPRELDQLFKEFLIGVTSFFRDPTTWAHLTQSLFPELLARLPPQGALRAWVPGCSTGEEAYSLAMAFQECLQQRGLLGRHELQIFATDLDRDAIDRARAGFFSDSVTTSASPERLARFFRKEARGYRVTPEIRKMVIFAPQNVIADPPFTRLDLLCCRNLLIYLTPELQKKLIPLFHFSLNPGGILLLGSAETIGNYTDLFEPVDGKLKLFRRRASSQSLPIDFPVAISGAPARETTVMNQASINQVSLVEQLILQQHSPAAVLTNDRGDIEYISARTGKYLEPSVGKASMNILAMAREGLRLELTDAFHHAIQRQTEVRVRDVKVGLENTPVVDLTVQPLSAPEGLRGMVLVIFTDVAPPEPGAPAGARRAPAQAPELENDVLRLKAELDSARAWMQSSQEKLKSTNEELQCTNEEFQSTNEELMTSKEELQSLNEELQTLNTALQSKVDELSRANDDMANLLNSTEIATVFLDSNLNVRRFTEMAIGIIKLIPGDVGRPLSDLVTALDYPELSSDARKVMKSLAFAEREASTGDGRWFRVRIMPYRTIDNMIDGLVLTFIDISTAKKLESELRERRGLGATAPR